MTVHILDAEAAVESPQKPAIVKVALQPDALSSLHSRMGAYSAAKQQSLLALAHSSNGMAQEISSDEELLQQFQVRQL